LWKEARIDRDIKILGDLEEEGGRGAGGAEDEGAGGGAEREGDV